MSTSVSKPPKPNSVQSLAKAMILAVQGPGHGPATQQSMSMWFNIKSGVRSEVHEQFSRAAVGACWLPRGPLCAPCGEAVVCWMCLILHFLQLSPRLMPSGERTSSGKRSRRLWSLLVSQLLWQGRMPPLRALAPEHPWQENVLGNQSKLKVRKR